MSVHSLSVKYVVERRDAGEIVERTAEQAFYRLRSFAQACPSNPARVNKSHVRRWMQVPDLSPAFRRARFSTVRGFCRWAYEHGHMPRDPTVGIKMPSVPPGLPRALRHDDAALVVAACPDLRTRLSVLLMLQEGMRRAEVAGIQVADVDFRAQTVAVRGKGGKGGVTRVVPVTDETASVMRQYMTEVGMRSGHLVRSVKWPDRGVSAAHLGALVTEAMYAAGVKRAAGDGVSPHALRHTAAHEMVDEGADVLEVQEALGHRSISNTMIYLRGHVSPNLRRAMGGRTYLRPEAS